MRGIILLSVVGGVFSELSQNCPAAVFAAAGSGGWGGIRTHGKLAPTLLFESSSLNHSDTHPHHNFTRFRDWYLQPLGHLSMSARSGFNIRQAMTDKDFLEKKRSVATERKR
jgi:hypothetical protein